MLQNQRAYTVIEKLGGPKRQGAEKLELAQVSVPVSVAGCPRVYCELTCTRVYVSMFLHVCASWKLLCVFIYIYVFACFWMFAGIVAILDFSSLQWSIGKLGIAATHVIIFHRVSCRDFPRNCQQVRLELSCSSIPRKTAGCCNLIVN